MESRLETPRLFGDARMPATQPLRAETFVYESYVIEITARVRDKPEMHSSYYKSYGREQFSRLLPFLKPGFHHVKWTLQTETKRKACFHYSGGNNQSA